MARRQGCSDVPVEVDVQMRLLEQRSCRVTGPDAVWKAHIVEPKDQRVLDDRRVSGHRPDDEEIRFMDRKGHDDDSANPGLEVYESGREMVIHQHLADGAIHGSNRRRRRAD